MVYDEPQSIIWLCVQVAVFYMTLCAIPHVTKRKTNSGGQSGYYATILSGKKDRGLLRLSTAKHLASSLRPGSMQISLFASEPIQEGSGNQTTLRLVAV